MDLSLKNKRVFISGSSRGIGLNIAKSFADEGARVVINSRNTNELKVAAASLGASGSVTGDVSDPEGANSTIARAVEILGGIDVVVCNVGSGISVPPGQETYKEWQRVFDLNFFSTTNLVEASKKVLEKSQGAIVCVSSICGSETIPGAPITYSVAKSALNTYVKSVATPLASSGIRINAVAPGNINFVGSTWEEKIAKDPDSVETMLKASVPLNKFGCPNDVANIVVWLASDLANFVTGAVFVTDGGQTRS